MIGPGCFCHTLSKYSKCFGMYDEDIQAERSEYGMFLFTFLHGFDSYGIILLFTNYKLKIFEIYKLNTESKPEVCYYVDINIVQRSCGGALPRHRSRRILLAIFFKSQDFKHIRTGKRLELE
ncbi:hypothetical protein BDQ17DRAFT_818313 [Cyathus striatus]|nr:hypothetical protein BDQ17DRAFT_818313 [Cyathus striatus]